MILGDNNIKQGVSYELKDKDTQLSLNGKLYSNSNFIMTLDGQFTVTDGVYLFDAKDGSRKGTLSLNFFVPGFKKFNPKGYPSKTYPTTQRTMMKNYEYLNKVNDSVFKNVIDLHIIMQLFQIPTSIIEFTNSTTINGVTFPLDISSSAILTSYEASNSISIQKMIAKYLPSTSTLIGANLIATKSNISTDLGNVTKTKTFNFANTNPIVSVTTLSELNIDALIKDYEKAYNRLTNFSEERNDIEIKYFKENWTYISTNYFGFSPYYERQGFDIYSNPSISTTSFSDNFKETRGDLFGVKASYNYVYLTKKKSYFIGRGIATFGRDSNFNDYSKKDYEYTNNIGTVNGNTIVSTDKKTAYQNKNNEEYSYGLLQKYGIELYASLNTLGVYTKIGYTKNDILNVSESYPFETGLLFNLKSEKKNIVSILLFVNRNNLKIHPDDDMNFGLKIGLPINLPRS